MDNPCVKSTMHLNWGEGYIGGGGEGERGLSFGVCSTDQ